MDTGLLACVNEMVLDGAKYLDLRMYMDTFSKVGLSRKEWLVEICPNETERVGKNDAIG